MTRGPSTSGRIARGSWSVRRARRRSPTRRTPPAADRRGGSAGRRRSAGAENRGQLVRRSHLELVVPAVRRWLVGPPAPERRPVPEPVALEVIVGDLGDPLDPERLP